jgi:hypothetical protein
MIVNVFLLVYKCWVAQMMWDKGGKNVYEQQFQSARFLNTYYNTSKVVANDIGAITYYTDIHLLDIAGLGSVETIHFNEDKKHFDQRFKTFLTGYCNKNKYEVAVVYENWLQGQVPDGWKKVAVLKIQDKFNVAQDEVSLYSVDPGNLQQLKNNIKGFNWNRNVRVTIVE